MITISTHDTRSERSPTLHVSSGGALRLEIAVSPSTSTPRVASQGAEGEEEVVMQEIVTHQSLTAYLLKVGVGFTNILDDVVLVHASEVLLECEARTLA